MINEWTGSAAELRLKNAREAWHAGIGGRDLLEELEDRVVNEAEIKRLQAELTQAQADNAALRARVPASGTMINEWTKWRIEVCREIATRDGATALISTLDEIERLQADNAALREELRESEAAKNMAFEIIIAQNNERELIRARVPASGTVAVPREMVEVAIVRLNADNGNKSRTATALQAILDAAAVDEEVK